jgi:hypothetical protein
MVQFFNQKRKGFTMKYSLITLVLCFTSIIVGQEVKELSKMDKFVSNVGEIVRFEDYNLPDIVAYNEKVTNKIRVIVTGKEKGYFFLIQKKDKYDTKTAAIAEDDLSDVISALDNLIENSNNEKGGPDYLENKFKTEDGFQIGYAKGTSITWFITLEKYGKSTILFDGFEGLKSGLASAQEKIKLLKQ